MNSRLSSFEEFSFDRFRGKTVFVFISGPGYLEFPWALETAIYLKNSGASVKVIDLSKLGELYAMRLKIFSIFLPYWSRSFLRKLMLKHNSLMENVIELELIKHGVNYQAFFVNPIKVYLSRNSDIRSLRDLVPTKWLGIDAFPISKSFFSNFEKQVVDLNYRLNIRLLNRVKCAVIESCRISQKIFKDNPAIDAVFLANGRQPVQTAIVTSFRKHNVPVYLYESAGGYIFPDKLVKIIGYLQSNPMNSVETIRMIAKLNYSLLSECEKSNLNEFISSIKFREQIAFKLNYLPKTTTMNSSLLTKTGRNLAFFTSSEWELSALDMADNTSIKISHFVNQASAVEHLISCMKAQDRSFIRVHPQDPGFRSKRESSWKKYEVDNRVHVFDEFSLVDSYNLAKKCDLNLVWQSFIGIEISLMGKPVGILGDAIYGPNFGESWLTDPFKLTQWISKPKLVSENDLMPYFTYLFKGGWAIRNSEVDSLKKVSVNSVFIDVPKFSWGRKYELVVRAIS